MRRHLRLWLPLLVLVPFTAFTFSVMARHGVLGFLALAGREPWGLQVFLDLMVSLFFAGAWIANDAKRWHIAPLPYLIALPLLGSPAAMLYAVHRGISGLRDPSLPRA